MNTRNGRMTDRYPLSQPIQFPLFDISANKLPRSVELFTMTTIFDYSDDPCMLIGHIGPRISIGWDDDHTFAMESEGVVIYVGNCPKCLSAGVLHEPCRYCHSKENPSYYRILTRGLGIVQPFYLAYCACKPTDVPSTPDQIRSFRYTRPQAELEAIEPNSRGYYAPLPMVEYHIKAPWAEVPDGVMAQAAALSTEERNRIYREGIILHDEHSKFFNFVTVRSLFKNFFDLQPTTSESLMQDAATENAASV